MNLKDYIRAGKSAGDITPLLGDASAFQELVNRLAAEIKDLGITKIVSIEGRGFIIGASVAYALNVGFVPVRYPGKLKNAVFSETFIDYSGKEKIIEIHEDALKPNEKVAILDDWVETGATVKSMTKLVEKCNGEILKIVSFMDDSSDELKEDLKKYNYTFLEKTADTDLF